MAALSAQGALDWANQAFRNLLLPGAGLPQALLQEARVALEQGRERSSTLELVPGMTCRCRFVPENDDAGTGRVLLEATPRPSAPESLDSLDARQATLFFQVLDDFPAFIYMQRQDYTVAYANKKVRDLYGDTDSRLCYEVFGGRDSPCPRCPTFEVFDTGKPVEWEFTDAQGRTFRIYDYPVEDEDGEPLVVELGIDITELRRVQKQLFEAQKVRAIGVMAGGLAHDLNNNLVPIIFNIEYALRRTSDQEASEVLSESLRAAYRAARLVEQVLEYSRQQEVSRSPISLAPLVRERVGAHCGALPDTVTLDLDIAVARDTVLANQSQIEQVLNNLLHNAAQAMPEGGAVSVSLTEAEPPAKTDPHPELKPGRYLVLRVCDTGEGIEPQYVERIFEPFFTTKKAQGGTGMGLALVYAAAKSCGGGVAVDSTPGIGTCFSVFFPASEGVVPRPAAEAEHHMEDGGRLLLVDDDPAALPALARTLRGAGFDVETARSGEEGLNLFGRDPSRYAMILADQSMPGMSGVDMAGRILEIDPTAHVVICTGYAEPDLEQQARDKGVCGFVMKPLSPAALIRTARRYSR